MNFYVYEVSGRMVWLMRWFGFKLLAFTHGEYFYFQWIFTFFGVGIEYFL